MSINVGNRVNQVIGCNGDTQTDNLLSTTMMLSSCKNIKGSYSKYFLQSTKPPFLAHPQQGNRNLLWIIIVMISGVAILSNGLFGRSWVFQWGALLCYGNGIRCLLQLLEFGILQSWQPRKIWKNPLTLDESTFPMNFHTFSIICQKAPIVLAIITILS